MLSGGCTYHEPQSLESSLAEGKKAYQQQSEADVVVILHGADWNAFVIKKLSGSFETNTPGSYLNYENLCQSLRNQSLLNADLVLLMLPVFDESSLSIARKFRADMSGMGIRHVHFQQGSSFLPPRRLRVD